MGKSHGTLSAICLHYLLLPDLTNPPQADRFHVDETRCWLFRYAAANWPLHMRLQSAATEESRRSARIVCRLHEKLTQYWAPIFFRGPHNSWFAFNDLPFATHLGLKPVVEDILCQEENMRKDLAKALEVAATEGYKDILQVLLDNGADNINKALCYASACGHRDIVLFLMEVGANDVNKALYWASESGQLEIVTLLLDAGADDLNDALYSSTLRDKQSHLDVAQLLIDRGADDLNRALHGAVNHHQIGVVGLLLDNGADDFERALETLSGGFHFDMVNMIIDKGEKSGKDKKELEKHFVPNNCVIRASHFNTWLI